MYSGTFKASGSVVSDSGAVTAEALFGAVPSPVAGVLQTVRTLRGNDSGSLTLRCTERISPPNQTSSKVSDAGTCVVLDATGPYSGLRGSGKLTGVTDFGATPVTLTDELVL
jgi:hypothetical protein